MMNKKWSVFSLYYCYFFHWQEHWCPMKSIGVFFDFIVMGILILSMSFGIKQVVMTTKNANYRVLIIGMILLVFILIWVELAVGIFDTPFAGSQFKLIWTSCKIALSSTPQFPDNYIINHRIIAATFVNQGSHKYKPRLLRGLYFVYQ